MENEGNNSPREIRLPPKRGEIKRRIFSGLAKKVMAVVTVARVAKNNVSAGSSSSATPPQSNYTPEGHSDS